jgi:hypothetical protein
MYQEHIHKLADSTVKCLNHGFVSQNCNLEPNSSDFGLGEGTPTAFIPRFRLYYITHSIYKPFFLIFHVNEAYLIHSVEKPR